MKELPLKAAPLRLSVARRVYRLSGGSSFTRHMFAIGVKRTSVAAIGAIALAVAAHAQSPTDWPAAAGDLGATKYAPVDQITPTNVTKLTQAWTYQPAVRRPSSSATSCTSSPQGQSSR